MIIVDHERCTGCGKCQIICHTNCIEVHDNDIIINHEMCSTCTQCIAICPLQALSWEGVTGKRLNNMILPRPEQIKEFLKGRRSIRRFRDEPLKRDILEDIAIISKYAPTNNFSIDTIIIDDREIIAQLEGECISFINRTYKLLYKPKIVFNLLRHLTPAVNFIDKNKTERTLRRGNIFQNAPALIILTADSRIPHTELSCQYALYNMILYAQSLGIGSCISGAGKMILSKNKKIKRLLGIFANKRIMGILFLGYPNVNFVNKTEGIKPKIQWNREG